MPSIETLDTNSIEMILNHLNDLMEQRRDLLVELDRSIEDGDVAMTTKKVFATLANKALTADEPLPGKYLIRIGTTVAKAAPSTMGTHLAKGFIRGGTAIADKTKLDVFQVAQFACAFLDETSNLRNSHSLCDDIIDAFGRAKESFENSASRDDRLTVAFDNAAQAVNFARTNECNATKAEGVAAKQEHGAKTVDPCIFLVALILKWISETIAQELAPDRELENAE